MPPEPHRSFQFTLRRALLAFVILSPCMLVLSAIIRQPMILLVAVILISATSLVFPAIVASLVVLNKAVGGQYADRDALNRKSRANSGVEESRDFAA